VLEQLGRLPREDDSAGLQDVAAVRDRERHVRVLLDYEDRHAGLVHLLDDLEVPLDQDRRETHRRLVHQQQLRPGHQCPAHRHHLLLAARERAGQLLAPLVQQREERVDALEVLLAPAALEVAAHLEVLAHAHRREEAPVLGHDRHAAPDPVARRSPGHVLAVEEHAALPWLDDPEARLQGRRLPGGVPPQQADELALADLDRDVVEDVDLPVVGVHPLELEQRRRGGGFGHDASSARRPR
jgi:hypothetical protein